MAFYYTKRNTWQVDISPTFGDQYMWYLKNVQVNVIHMQTYLIAFGKSKCMIREMKIQELNIMGSEIRTYSISILSYSEVSITI